MELPTGTEQTGPAVRQAAHRAREHIRAHRPRFSADVETAWRLADSPTALLWAGDFPYALVSFDLDPSDQRIRAVHAQANPDKLSHLTSTRTDRRDHHHPTPGTPEDQMTEPRTVTVHRTVPAPPEVIFELLRTPARHHELDGSGMVQGAPAGPERLGPGDEFSMAMRQGPMAYRSVSRVVEYEQDRLISWETTGRWRNRKIIGGQWWRFELVPGSDGTLVRHSYLWGKASWPVLTVRLPGYPRRMAATMPTTLERLEAAVGC